MTIGFVYWLLLLIGVILGVLYRTWPTASPYVWPVGGMYALILFVLIGIGLFGWPIRG